MGESATSHIKSGNWANRMKSIHGLRKRNKPLVEKKRRARINESLAQLKALVIESMQKNVPQSYSKLEKADILEMTVKHLKQLKQQIQDREMVSKYHVGYSECASEVVKYLGQARTEETGVRSRLLDHLSTRVPSGSHETTQQPRTESYAPPSSEVASRLGNNYHNITQTDSDSFFEVEGTQRLEEKSLGFYNGNVDGRSTQHGQSGVFTTARMDGSLVPSATATRPTRTATQPTSTCDAMQENINQNGMLNRLSGMPLSDIAPRDVQNRMPLSIDVSSTYAPECSSSAKVSLPPFQIFTQPFRQVDGFQNSKYNRSEHDNNSSQISQMEQYHGSSNQFAREATLPEIEHLTEDSLHSPNFLAHGMLGIGDSQVWRPW